MKSFFFLTLLCASLHAQAKDSVKIPDRYPSCGDELTENNQIQLSLKKAEFLIPSNCIPTREVDLSKLKPDRSLEELDFKQLCEQDPCNDFIIMHPENISSFDSLRAFSADALSRASAVRVFKQMKKLKNVKALRITRTLIGDFPIDVLELRSLEELVLDDVNSIPKEIVQLGRLKRLLVVSSTLRTLPEELKQFKKLELGLLSDQFPENTRKALKLKFPKVQFTFIDPNDSL